MTRAYTLETKEIETLDGTQTFVKIEKQAEWLYKATAGKTATKQSLRRTKLLDDLKERLVKTVVGCDKGCDQPAVADEVASQPLVAPEAAAEAEVADPMLQLAAVGDSVVTPKKKRKGYLSKRAKNNITEVTMPEQERTSHPACTTMRTVRLLATGTNSLWIAAEDIPWLVNCLADEVRSGGVPVPDDIRSGEELHLEENCAAPGVHMRWDFDGAWEAIVVAGQHKGKKVRSLVANLTDEKWRAAGVDGSFASATPELKKQATFAFLEMHMRQALEEAA